MSEEKKWRLSPAIVESARDAMKAGMIINGAAAIALLAFIGKIWSDAKDIEAVGPLADSILYFSIGAAMSGFAFACNYAVLENENLFNLKRTNIIEMTLYRFIQWTWALMAILPFCAFLFGIIKFHGAIYDHFA